MPEVLEDRETVKPRRSGSRKAAVLVEELRAVGPNRGTTVMIPEEVWKDIAKRAIDEGMDFSSLVVKWLREKMRVLGYYYLGDKLPEGVSASQVNDVNNSGEADPVSETMTSSGGDGGATAAGEGERLGAPQSRGRKARAQSSGG